MTTHTIAIAVAAMFFLLELPGWSVYKNKPEVDVKSLKTYVNIAFTAALAVLLWRLLA